jgi:hypothetical protein
VIHDAHCVLHLACSVPVIAPIDVPRCYRWNTPKTKLLGELAWDVATSEKCCDFCCDLDLKNPSVLPTSLRRCDLQGGSPPSPSPPALRPRFLVTGS